MSSSRPKFSSFRKRDWFSVAEKGSLAPKTEGLDRIVQEIHGRSSDLERRDDTTAAAAQRLSDTARKTLTEIIRHKSDAGTPGTAAAGQRESREATGVDGPNLVTHLPDVVVQSDHRRPLPFRVTTQAVLLFLDISGFTALCEKYSQAAKTGTEQLTKTLNGYMSALVSEIITYDGDILKFAGDAILCMWPVDTLLAMALTVENVILCALDIQRKHGTYTTNDGVTLKVIGVVKSVSNLAPRVAVHDAAGVRQSISQSVKVFYSGLSNLNHCEVH